MKQEVDVTEVVRLAFRVLCRFFLFDNTVTVSIKLLRPEL